MKYLLLISIFVSMHLTSWSQCPNPTTMLSENFDSAPVTGAITANIYGSGFWNNAAYTISGAGHGWFNVINGLGNVDVYDRQVTGFCVDSAVTVSFWTRHSFGLTNVTFSVIDDLNTVLQTTTLNLTNTYQQIVYNFNATTTGFAL